jgi:general secretion pathway protein G
MMKSMKRKGFTLVELLIVIVIIGILAGSMMMLMGSSTDKAEATKIISDLRVMKGAVLQYYADHSGYPDNSDDPDVLEPYIDKTLDNATYDMCNTEGVIFVGKKVPTAGAGEKLVQMIDNDQLKMWYKKPAADIASTDAEIDPTSDTIDADGFVYQRAN